MWIGVKNAYSWVRSFIVFRWHYCVGGVGIRRHDMCVWPHKFWPRVKSNNRLLMYWYLFRFQTKTECFERRWFEFNIFMYKTYSGHPQPHSSWSSAKCAPSLTIDICCIFVLLNAWLMIMLWLCTCTIYAVHSGSHIVLLQTRTAVLAMILQLQFRRDGFVETESVIWFCSNEFERDKFYAMKPLQPVLVSLHTIS